MAYRELDSDNVTLDELLDAASEIDLDDAISDRNPAQVIKMAHQQAIENKLLAWTPADPGKITQVYSNPNQEHEQHSLPNAEVFHSSDYDLQQMWGENINAHFTPGYYYWFCFPGCLPDSDPYGPFETQEDAIRELQDPGKPGTTDWLY